MTIETDLRTVDDDVQFVVNGLHFVIDLASSSQTLCGRHPSLLLG
jgi:hypothetical protein